MDVEKNGGRFFRKPKLTLSCSAEGKEGRNEINWRVDHPTVSNDECNLMKLVS
jgi:hypothetical protein